MVRDHDGIYRILGSRGLYGTTGLTRRSRYLDRSLYFRGLTEKTTKTPIKCLAGANICDRMGHTQNEPERK